MYNLFNTNDIQQETICENSLWISRVLSRVQTLRGLAKPNKSSTERFMWERNLLCVSYGCTKVTTTPTVPAWLCRDFIIWPLLWMGVVLCMTFSTPGRHNVCRWRCRYAGTWNIKTITHSLTLTKLQGQKIMSKDARGCWLTRVTISVCLRQHRLLRLITCQMQLVRSWRCDKMITFSRSVHFCPWDSIVKIKNNFWSLIHYRCKFLHHHRCFCAHTPCSIGVKLPLFQLETWGAIPV